MNLDLARLAIAGYRGSRRRLLANAEGVAIPRRGHFPGLVEPLETIFTQGFQHREPGLVIIGLHRHDEALRGEGRERLQQVAWKIDNRVGRLQGERSGERRQSPEDRLLVPGQQVS